MKKYKNPTCLLCALLLCLLTAGCAEKAVSPPPAPDTPDAVNTQNKENSEDAGTAAQLGSLQSFSAATLDGGTFTQDDIAAKDVTVINFWALTCPPCIREMPDIAAFAEALPDNVQVITVCLDGAWDEEGARTVLSGAGFDGVTLLSGDGDFQALCESLLYTPTTVFADSEGNLVGNALIGGQEDLSAAFLAAVNTVLTESGKAEISLAE